MSVDQNGKPVCCERCGHDLVQYLTHVPKRVGSSQSYDLYGCLACSHVHWIKKVWPR
jgi:RNase P subunit RPR2